MMLGPLSSKVNKFCLLSAGSRETEPPILTLILVSVLWKPILDLWSNQRVVSNVFLIIFD